MLKCIFILLCSLGSCQVFAQTNYLLEVASFAEEYVRQQVPVPPQAKVNIKAASLDARLKLGNCTKPLIANIPNGAIRKNTVVKVICPQPQWDIYVPVKVRTLLPVVVATKTLSPGTVLNKNTLSVVYKETHLLRGGIVSLPEKLFRTRVKRTIPAGKAVSTRDICYVCKGDKVIIWAKKGSLTIKTTGFAIGNAALGDTIKARNAKTKKVVVGTVAGIGVVEVNI